MTDAKGIGLAVGVAGFNAADVAALLPAVDAVPDLSGDDGEGPTEPEVLYADRGDDSDPHREGLRDRGIEPKVAERRTEHGSGLGVSRWVVERTNAGLHSFDKLRVRTDPDGPTHEALVKLASAFICMWFL